MDAIRTFIAVELPEPVRASLGGLIHRLAPAWPERGVRWIEPDKMHLTLRFLGETDPAKLPSLESGLDQIAGQVPPFDLLVRGIGCFPHPRRPRVIWAGLQDPDGRLSPLQKEVEQMVRALGWKKENRPFKPHLTLGRVRERVRPPEGEWMVEPEEQTFRIESVCLIESRLKPSGAEYVALHRSALRR